MYIVFDIGGTNMRLALADNTGLIGDPITCPTPQKFSDAIELFTQVSTQLLQGKKPTAAAGGIPGPLNHDHSVLVSAQNLPDWVGKPLQTELETILGCEVLLDNDTAIGALGEVYFGAGKNYDIVSYLTVGTGVGGCRIVNGNIDPSAQGFEPGAQIISQTNRSVLTLEQLVSGAALRTRYSWEPGQKISEELADELAWNLAVGIHNLIMLWSPDVIIIGGGVFDSGDIPITKVNSYVAQIMDKFPTQPPIIAAELKGKSGLYGALRLIQSAS